MEIDRIVRERLALEASTMQPRYLDLGIVTGQGRRIRVLRRLMTGASIAACVVGVWLVATAVGEGDKGTTLHEVVAPDATRAALDAEATETVKAFVSAVDDRNENRSWEFLSSNAQQRVGSLDDWAQKRNEVSRFLSWIAAPEVDVVLTQLPLESGDRFVATAVAPPADGQALLQAVPLIQSGDGFMIDLVSADFRRSVSLEPLNPKFYSGVSCESCPEGISKWPEVRDETLFSVALEPAGEVDDVWFAVGSEWVAAAEAAAENDRMIAEATFDGGEVEPGEKVFLVAIQTNAGLLETYGYRVVYTQN